MERRPSGLSLPSTKSTTPSFTSPSSKYLQSLSHQASSQHNPSFTSLSPHAHSQITSDPSSTQHFSQSLLLDDSASLLGDDRPDNSQHTVDFDLNVDLTSYTTTRKHEPKVPSQTPWNPFNLETTPMSSQFKHALSNIQQPKRPYTDSGYASSQKSRQRIPNNIIQPDRSFEAARHYPYDEPIDSAAQQQHFLFDQQRQLPQTVSLTTRKAASVAGDTTLTPSGSQSFRCDECAEKFNTKSEMSKHMNRHNKKHVCDVAGCSRATDGFATKNDLDRHKGSVHHDQTVARKEYRCRVQNCKDPNKKWDRKDNFKAHVRRMHPDVDADEIVKLSLVSDKPPQNERAISNAGNHAQDFGMSNYDPTTSNAQLSLYRHDEAFNTYRARLDDDVYGEGDMYDASTSTGPRPQPYPPQLDPRSFTSASFVPANSFLSPMATVPHNFTQSNTIVASSNAQDPIPPLFAHRMHMTPGSFNGTTMNRTRPLEARTAPPMGQVGDEFRAQQLLDIYQSGDTSSLADSNLNTIDPSLQLTHSGGWLTSSSTNYPQQADIPDYPMTSNVATGVAESSTTSPVAVNENRVAAVQQEITSILEELSPDQIKTMVSMLAKHPSVPNKENCALEAMTGPAARPYECSRDGCSKRFDHKNVMRKHEKRHDRLFFCTFDGCYSVFGTKDDLRRHEIKKHEPQHFHGWRCFPEDVPTSQHKLECAKFFDNKESFKQHRREIHHERAEKNNGDLKAVKQCQVHQGLQGHFWCGFCNRVILNEPNGTDGTKRDKFRYDHLNTHITKENKTIAQWIDLKSEGLTKLDVKKLHTHPATNDESDEEEAEQLSPADVSTTIGGSISHIPAQSNQQRLGVASSVIDGPNRKRAASDVDHYPLFPAKAPRIGNHQQPIRQATMMSLGISQSPTSSSSLMQPQLNHQTRPQPVWIQCCQCKTKRYIIDGQSCGYNACFHRRCSNCLELDNMSNPIQSRSSVGHGHGGGA